MLQSASVPGRRRSRISMHALDRILTVAAGATGSTPDGTGPAVAWHQYAFTRE